MNKRKLTLRARELRRNPTPAERLLWSRLKKRKLNGWKFRRQHVLVPMIVDFYTHDARVAVELDGEHHHQSRDQCRDAYLLKRYGVRVLRLANEEVLFRIDEALECIEKHCLQALAAEETPD